jgi:hypothetical protein
VLYYHSEAEAPPTNILTIRVRSAVHHRRAVYRDDDFCLIHTKRDDFPAATIRTLASRAGHHCSNPKCVRPTSGPAYPRPIAQLGVEVSQATVGTYLLWRTRALPDLARLSAQHLTVTVPIDIFIVATAIFRIPYTLIRA